MPSLDVHVQPSPSPRVDDAVTSSEAASLKGHKAETPIIAGSVCGGLMGVAWIIGFIVYFLKKRKRKQRKAKEAAGFILPKQKKRPEKPAEKIIVPPDPAIILGHRRPGESAFLDDQRSPNHGPSPSTAPPKPLNTEQVANLSRAVISQQSPQSASPTVMVREASPVPRYKNADGATIPRKA